MPALGAGIHVLRAAQHQDVVGVMGTARTSSRYAIRSATKLTMRSSKSSTVLIRLVRSDTAPLSASAQESGVRIGDPDPRPHQHVLCRARQPHHADAHAALYSADQCFLKKDGEPRL